ncbi:MAG: hypothetical protein ACPGOY_08835 [Rhodospirillaceae bacterium]
MNGFAQTTDRRWNPRTGRFETIDQMIDHAHTERSRAAKALVRRLWRPVRPF